METGIPARGTRPRAPHWGWMIGVPLATAGAALLYQRMQRRAPPGRHALPIEVATTVTIRRSADELFAWWRDFSRLPTFMRHIESVTPLAENRWHWVARMPGWEREVGWDAEVIEERPGELIRWRSLAGSEVDHQGEVRFVPAPGGRGTELHTRIAYRPGGAAATAAARLMETVTEQVIKEELRRFKELMETGEIPTVEGQPTG